MLQKAAFLLATYQSQTFCLHITACFDSEMKAFIECCLSCLISEWPLLLYDNCWHECSMIQCS